jgi:hypothetical protein
MAQGALQRSSPNMCYKIRFGLVRRLEIDLLLPILANPGNSAPIRRSTEASFGNTRMRRSRRRI